MILPSEELSKRFDANRKLIDKAYEDTLIKYGTMQASSAMYHYFRNYDCSYITNSNGSRAKLKHFVNCYYQNQQILFDYAISSFILNEMKDDISIEEINMYVQDEEGKLNYDPANVTKVVALSIAAWGPYWASQLIACNEKFKAAIVESFINERYINNRANDLDACKGGKLVNLGSGKRMLSHSNLNNDMLNMMNQDEEEFFDSTNVNTNQVSYESR